MEFKADHFSQSSLSGFNTGASTSPLTIGGGDMSIPINRPGGLGNLALDRRKQINTLLIFNENVTELVPNAQYRMDFTGGGTCGPLTMFIQLPLNFPKEKPSIRIEPLGLHHSWLDRSGNVIGSPGLNKFSAHSDLGRVVQVIKREFELNPPISNSHRQAVQSNSQVQADRIGWSNIANHQHSDQANSNTREILSNSSYHAHVGRGISYPVAGNSHQYSLAPVSQHSTYCNYDKQTQNDTTEIYSSSIHHSGAVSSQQAHANVIPEVAVLTDAELKELSENEPALLKFCQNLSNPVMKSSQDKYEKTFCEIEDITELSESLSTAIKSKRESLVKQYKEYDQIRSDYENVRKRFEKAKDVHSVANLSKVLEAAAISDEEESEKCADDFLNSGSSVEQFIKDYTAIRTSHVKKRAKFDSVMQKKNTELKETSKYNPSWPKY